MNEVPEEGRDTTGEAVPPANPGGTTLAGSVPCPFLLRPSAKVLRHLTQDGWYETCWPPQPSGGPEQRREAPADRSGAERGLVPRPRSRPVRGTGGTENERRCGEERP